MKYAYLITLFVLLSVVCSPVAFADWGDWDQDWYWFWGGSDGYDDGSDPGYDDGSDPGYDDGSDIGYDDGSDPGYDDGSDPGYDDGSDPGYDDGSDGGDVPDDGLIDDPGDDGFIDDPGDFVDPFKYNPVATIISPPDNAQFFVLDKISFIGSATDLEDGTLNGTSLVWTSSIDGNIGTGDSFVYDSLSAGTHLITLTATDSDGDTGYDTVTIDVLNEPEPQVTVRSAGKADRLYLSRISFPEFAVRGETAKASISVENQFGSKLEDLEIRALVQGMENVRGHSGRFDLKNKESINARLSLRIPADAEPGIYTVRVTVSNDDIKRVRFRDMMVIE